MGGNVQPGEPDAVVSLNQTSATEFEFVVDLGSSLSSFGGASINAGAFTMNLENGLVFTARGSSSNKLAVEIVDINGKVSRQILQLSPIDNGYTLSLSGGTVPPGFERTQISHIHFVADHQLFQIQKDLIQIRIRGLNYTPVLISEELEAMRQNLIQKGVDYFLSSGIDTATGMPIDRVKPDGSVDPGFKFTQPTLIGFYLQILSEIVNGSIVSNNLNIDQSLARLNHVMDTLLQFQNDFGWKGLIPWVDLDPLITPAATVGVGDNANLSQSLAVMIGTLEKSLLSISQKDAADSVITKAELFLNNQETGYLGAVDTQFGLLAGEINRTTGIANFFLDRLMTEFRGAIAFLKIRYPLLPKSIWQNLPTTVVNYTDSTGTTIQNFQSYEGGAFQYFWPLLRNNELDFLSMRDALYNHFVTQTDFASSNRIPGFLSASETTGQGYEGLIGIPQIAETGQPLLYDLGSTYALASAYQVSPEVVLTWLKSIQEQIPGASGIFGILDSARSDYEIGLIYLGIDVASTVLGLSGRGADFFDAYLRKRGFELSYNLLYEEVNDYSIQRTSLSPDIPPTFYDQTYSVFDRAQGQGTIFDMPNLDVPTVRGARFIYGTLSNGWGGRFWSLPFPYNARKKTLVIDYAVTDTPKEIVIELKNASNTVIFSVTKTLDSSSGIHELLIDLPDTVAMEQIKVFSILVNQNQTLDTRGDFYIYSATFRQPII